MTRAPAAEIVLVAPGPLWRKNRGATLRMPLSLLSLASWLNNYSSVPWKISLLDTRLDVPTPEHFANAKIVEISAMTGAQVKHGILAAQVARTANPAATIVWGGVHATLLPAETAKSEFVDCVVIGEGEETFREIVEHLYASRDLTGISGTCVVDKNGNVQRAESRPFIDMEQMPIPQYDLLDISRYDGIRNQFDYQSSRGCPYRCDFCYNTAFSGRKWRSKSAKKVVGELQQLTRECNVKTFAFVDDEFFINKARVEEFVDLIGPLNLGVSFSASCRLDIVQRFPRTLLEKLKRVGFKHMYFGAESGSGSMLESMHKQISITDIVKGSLLVAGTGIRPVLSFMSGFPNESLAQFRETLTTIEKVTCNHRLITVNGIFPYSPYPGTRMFKDALSAGLSPPKSLEQWGDWNFQYTPDNPWLSPKKSQMMEVAFYIIRFRYYLAMYTDQHPNSIRSIMLNIFAFPFSFLGFVRMKTGLFAFPIEWKLFAFAARKTFGYL